MVENDYGNGLWTMAGDHRESPRYISNVVCDQEGLIPNDMGASDMVWQWGQFLDHDIDLTEPHEPHEEANIPVPLGDPFFDPFHTGTATIGFERSVFEPDVLPRQQINQITAWIDGSNVYGSDPVRQKALRANDGTGRMATSEGDLLPFNTEGLPNAGGTGPEFFLAGDFRAETSRSTLTAMHTLFVREHNYWSTSCARCSRTAGSSARERTQPERGTRRAPIPPATARRRSPCPRASAATSCTRWRAPSWAPRCR